MVEAKTSKNKNIEQESDSKLKFLIRKYLDVDCYIVKEIENDNIDFGFNVKYPNIYNNEGEHIGNLLSILKPKGKNFLQINNRIHLHKKGLDLFNNLNDLSKKMLKKELFTFLINQNVLFSLDIENNDIAHFDNVYFTDSNFPNINDFYHSIIKIINTQMYLLEILNGELKLNDINDSNFDYDNSYYK